MSTTRFDLRKETKDKEGRCILRLVYQIAGDRKRYNTDLKAWPENWDAKGQKVIYLDKAKAKKLLPGVDYDTLPTKKEVDELNAKIRGLADDIADIEKYFEVNRIEYTTTKVIEELKERHAPLARKEAVSNEVYVFIDKYIAANTATRVKGSLSVYKSLSTHLQDFQRHTGRKVIFEAIDKEFFQSFQAFLISSKGTTTNRKGERVPRKPLNNTTTAKQLSTLKTFLNYAREEGRAVSDRYRDFKIRRESLEVIALTNEEFETLFYFDLSNNKKLAQVRDVFCFACTTGLRYSDLRQLKREHIKENHIRITVKKTKEPLTIPLKNLAKSILSKYEEQLNPLPVISNQKMNKYLKELCKKAKIDEPIEIVRFYGARREAITYPKYELVGVHTGRKTFATLSLERGISAEVVMATTGHKDYKSFKRYIKVTEKVKDTSMNAWDVPIGTLKLKAV